MGTSNSSFEILKPLIDEITPNGWIRVVRLDSTLPAEVFNLLAGSTSTDMRWYAAANAGVPKALLRSLMREHRSRVVAGALENPQSIGMRQSVVKRWAVSDRVALAQAYTTPQALLARLALEPSLVVKRWVASNPHTPQRAFIELCKEKRLWEELASNKGLHSRPLNVLLDEFEKASRTGVRGLTDGLSYSRLNRRLSDMVTNPRCSAKALGRIFHMGAYWVQEQVLGCANCSNELLNEGFRSGGVKGQIAVIRNPLTTQEMLAEFNKIQSLMPVVRKEMRIRIGKQLGL